MSLAVAALRITAYLALLNATSAGARVFDSAVDPVSLLGAAAAPTVVVYTGKGIRRPRGKALFECNAVAELTIELFVGRGVTVQSGSDQVPAIEYPPTDPSFENILRRLAYECESILFGSDGPWAILFRDCVTKFADQASEWDRGADIEGSRFNFLRDTLRLEIISDPVRGAPIETGSVWERLLTALDGNQDTRDIARDWRVLMTTPSLPAWRAARAELGLNDESMTLIGVGPLEGQVEDSGNLVVVSELAGEGAGAVITVTNAGATMTLDDDPDHPVQLVESDG